MVRACKGKKNQQLGFMETVLKDNKENAIVCIYYRSTRHEKEDMNKDFFYWNKFHGCGIDSHGEH